MHVIAWVRTPTPSMTGEQVTAQSHGWLADMMGNVEW